ncbi:MAG: hypothetical protein VB875_07570 [Pirellulales bacterium]
MGTGFKRFSRRQACAVLALFAAAVVFCVWVSLSPLGQGRADVETGASGSDIALYKALADRVGCGESYYAVLAEELPARGYPTRSVFNWRTPLPMCLIGVAPEPIFAKGLLCILAGSVLLMGFEIGARDGGRVQSVLTALLLVGGILPCFVGDLYVMPVLWAGVLIAVSVCALGLGWRKSGVAAGIAAVFFRDVAGPYCVLALCAAIWQRRFKEALLWLGGLAAYAAFFLWHWVQIDPLRSADAAAHSGGWVQFGGAAFVIATAQMNGFLLNLPQWVTAVYLPLALLGFASWQSRAGQFAGLSSVLFAVLFSFVGWEFNQYWGSITAPLLCLGAARAPLALRDLWGRSAITNPFHHGLTDHPRRIAS